jgi:transcriptional regulator
MYVPAAFAVTDPSEVEAALASQTFGCLVTGQGEGLFATHMPFLYDAAARRLSGHMARPNPHWERAGEGEALVIFQGPHAYISPSWYPSKQEHGRVVPTWNYEAVHVYGRPSWRHERDWLVAHVSALTARHEAGRDEPWAVSDAPEGYIQGLSAGIVGMELAIARVEVKRKLSQNRSEADRRGVIAGLGANAAATDRELAAVMARDLT